MGYTKIMVYTTYIRTTGIVLSVLLVLAIASPAEARHNTGSYGYSSSLNKKIKALDEDEVDEFAIPVLFGVVLKNITPNFGDPRDGGARTHEGEDIMGILGTPIVSPTEAVVISKGDGDSSGNYVRTANPGGESFVYMHLDKIADIKSGDVLKAGDFIGTVGDTGNAKGGPAHLHFEVREGEAKDPFPRITKEFTLEEKAEFVTRMFSDLDDEDKMAEFLIQTYKKEFTQALNAGYKLPEEIVDELAKNGIISTAELVKKLDEIILSIPSVLTHDLTLGSQGSEVSLLQFYLIYVKTGPQAAVLASSGATGYFGSVTQAALIEYQLKTKVEPTGTYDAATRKAMIQ